VEGTKAAVSLRASGVPILHLPEDLEPDAAATYATSVEAVWICYPTRDDGAKLAVAHQGAPFEAVKIEDVADRVLGGMPEGARR
jgi:hypothetical protein